MSHKSQRRLFGVLFIIITVTFLALIPAVAVLVNEDITKSIEQETNEKIKLEENYYSQINNTGDYIDIKLINNESSYEVDFKRLNLTEQKTFTVNSEDFLITYSKNLSVSSSFVKYQYSRYLNIPQTAELIIKNLPLILISLYILIISFGLIIISRREKND